MEQTYVRDFRPIVREGIARLAREGWENGRGIWDSDQDGRSLTVDKIRVREVKAIGHVAQVFGLDEGSRSSSGIGAICSMAGWCCLRCRHSRSR